MVRTQALFTKVGNAYTQKICPLPIDNIFFLVRLEGRMVILEEHNRQLETQLGKLKQILEVQFCFILPPPVMPIYIYLFSNYNTYIKM